MNGNSLMAAVLCGTPAHESLRLSSAPGASPQIHPFFPHLVISQGAGMGASHGEVPMRLKLPACLFPFSLFFLLEVEHHQGVRFSAIQLLSHPKKEQLVHTHTHKHSRLILRKRLRMCSCNNFSHICRHANYHTGILSTGVTRRWLCINRTSFVICFACVCVCV